MWVQPRNYTRYAETTTMNGRNLFLKFQCNFFLHVSNSIFFNCFPLVFRWRMQRDCMGSITSRAYHRSIMPNVFTASNWAVRHGSPAKKWNVWGQMKDIWFQAGPQIVSLRFTSCSYCLCGNVTSYIFYELVMKGILGPNIPRNCGHWA
jgi:hypothetical protein